MSPSISQIGSAWPEELHGLTFLAGVFTTAVGLLLGFFLPGLSTTAAGLFFGFFVSADLFA